MPHLIGQTIVIRGKRYTVLGWSEGLQCFFVRDERKARYAIPVEEFFE